MGTFIKKILKDEMQMKIARFKILYLQKNLYNMQET